MILVDESQAMEWCKKRGIRLDGRMPYFDRPSLTENSIEIPFPPTISKLSGLLRNLSLVGVAEKDDFLGGLFVVRETGVSDEFYDDSIFLLLNKTTGFQKERDDGIIIDCSEQQLLFTLMSASCIASWNSWFINQHGSAIVTIDDDEYIQIRSLTQDVQAQIEANLAPWRDK